MVPLLCWAGGPWCPSSKFWVLHARSLGRHLRGLRLWQHVSRPSDPWDPTETAPIAGPLDRPSDQWDPIATPFPLGCSICGNGCQPFFNGSVSTASDALCAAHTNVCAREAMSRLALTRDLRKLRWEYVGCALLATGEAVLQLFYNYSALQ